MIQRVFFDLGLTLAESDGPSHYVERLAQLGYSITPAQAQNAYHLANKYFMREHRGALGKGSQEVLRNFLEKVWTGGALWLMIQDELFCSLARILARSHTPGQDAGRFANEAFLFRRGQPRLPQGEHPAQAPLPPGPPP